MVGRGARWQCGPQCVLTTRAGLDPENNQTHMGWNLGGKASCVWFRHPGRDPRAERARESTARKGVEGGEIQEGCTSLSDPRYDMQRVNTEVFRKW